MTESDGTTNAMFPQEARLRNLTYSAPLSIDMKSTLLSAGATEDPIEADWKPVLDAEGNIQETEDKAFIGKVSLAPFPLPLRFPGSRFFR
jgi:DNA-directed RNA polymerase II subunit RPB2